ncbi:hypothetical protein GCM10018955_19020 [Planomonospora venezuelensis]
MSSRASGVPEAVTSSQKGQGVPSRPSSGGSAVPAGPRGGAPALGGVPGGPAEPRTVWRSWSIRDTVAAGTSSSRAASRASRSSEGAGDASNRPMVRNARSRCETRAGSNAVTAPVSPLSSP